MVDLVDLIYPLHLRILEEVPRCKCAVEGDEDVLVDGGGDQAPAEPPVVGGKVGASAAEGDSEWGSGDDQRILLWAEMWLTRSISGGALPIDWR